MFFLLSPELLCGFRFVFIVRFYCATAVPSTNHQCLNSTALYQIICYFLYSVSWYVGRITVSRWLANNVFFLLRLKPVLPLRYFSYENVCMLTYLNQARFFIFLLDSHDKVFQPSLVQLYQPVLHQCYVKSVPLIRSKRLRDKVL